MLASYIPIHLLSLDYIAIYADSRASLHNLGPLCVRAGGFGHPHVPGGPLRRAGAARAGPSGRPEEVQRRQRRAGAGEGRPGAEGDHVMGLEGPERHAREKGGCLPVTIHDWETSVKCI